MNLSGTAGTVFLANQKTALPAPPAGSVTGDSQIADLVGYGTSNTFETAVAPAPGTTTSVSRSAVGADTDDNGADLKAGPPSPQNTTSGDGGGCGGPATEQTIAQIQGTGGTSPLVGRTVTTSGVVTAAYPTGGFNGFYIQTPGTGGDLPTRRHARPTRSSSSRRFAVRPTPAIGDHVQVTGAVSEFNGLTELSPAAAGVDHAGRRGRRAGAGHRSPTRRPTRAARRSRACCMRRRATFTVTDNFTLNQYGEIGLASRHTPLRQPTDVAPARLGRGAGRGRRQRRAGGHARRRRVDELPVSAPTRASRCRGSPGQPGPGRRRPRLHQAGGPRLPQQRLEAPADQPADPGQRRHGAAGHVREHPHRGAASTSAATSSSPRFNVLNYFTSTGAGLRGRGGTPARFNDRAGNPITVNNCGADGPRGAWDDADLAAPAGQDRRGDQRPRRRRAVAGGDRELRQVRRPENRDDALATLVAALNADAGADGLGVRALAGRGRPAGARRAGRDPHRVHLQDRQGGAGRRRRRPRPARHAVRQRARAAGPGVQAGGRRRVAGVPRGREPLQVQGLRLRAGRRPGRRPGRLQRDAGRQAQGAGRVRRRPQGPHGRRARCSSR